MRVKQGGMWPYHPELLEKPVPRYTSYPPATEFTPSVGVAQQIEALNAIEAGTPFSIYVHIPYCNSICWYCGCNTGLAAKEHRLQTYLEALEAEITLVGKLMGGRGKLERIAFGGGSPNAIKPVAFVRLVDRLTTLFGGNDVDISVEIDPRSFTLEWALTLAVSNVRRVSFGVQSFDPEIQAAIGRIQPVEMIETCVAALRARGISSINFDLMYGLPLQTMEKLDATLDDVLRLRPERIALFGYAHLPSMFPRQKRIDATSLPDARMRFEMAAHGHDRLVAEGYVQIGFDHFALPGDSMAKAAASGRVRRNFQGFTDDNCDVVVGLGASAISLFPDRIIQNEKRAGPYRDALEAGRLAGARGTWRDADARKRARIIETLLCQGHAEFSDPQDMVPIKAALEKFACAGLVTCEEKGIRLTDDGLPYSRHVAALFDASQRVV